MSKKYEFQFSENAEKNFASLENDVKKRILKKLVYFERAKEPFSFAKKLIGLEDNFSFRIGDYRVIVSPQDKKTLVILVVLKIGQRREVYNP